MQRCPHCGAENSAKRTICYNCEKELAGAPQDGGPAPSRWQALETTKRKTVTRSMEESIAKPLQTRGPVGGQTTPTSQPATGQTARPGKVRITPPRATIPHLRQMAILYRGFETVTRAGISIVSACHQMEVSGPGRFRGLRARDGRRGRGRSAHHLRAGEVSHLPLPLAPGGAEGRRKRRRAARGLRPDRQAYEDEWKTRAQIAVHTTFYTIMYLPCVFLILPFLKFFEAPIPDKGWQMDTAVPFLLKQFHDTSLPLAEVMLALVVLWFVLSTMAWFQRLQQWVVLGIPLVGRVVRMAALDRYLSTLSMMLRGGIPLSEALRESAQAAGNLLLTPASC